MSDVGLDRKEESEEYNVSTLLQFLRSHVQKLYVDHLPVESIKELPIKC
jgi:hypothetical protein